MIGINRPKKTGHEADTAKDYATENDAGN